MTNMTNIPLYVWFDASNPQDSVETKAKGSK